jgi:hypothetical protein
MLKVKKDHTCKSVWKNDDLFDIERTKTYKVTIFGLTLWSKTEDYKSDWIYERNDKIGFK